MKKNTLATLLFTAIFALGATSAFAEQPKEEKSTPAPMVKKEHKERFHEKFQNALFENLNLTEEQEAEINKINQKNKEERRENHRSNMRAMFSMHKDIKDVSLSDDFSEEKVNSIVDKYSSEIKNNIVEQAKIENEIYNVLTPEQKVTYKENIQKFEDQIKQRKMTRK